MYSYTETTHIATSLFTQSEYEICIPALPSHLDAEYEGCREDITCYIDPVDNGESYISSDELEFACLTKELSGPLTLLMVGAKFGLARGREICATNCLAVHIVGAALFEMIGIIKLSLIHI